MLILQVIQDMLQELKLLEKMMDNHQIELPDQRKMIWKKTHQDSQHAMDQMEHQVLIAKNKRNLRSAQVINYQQILMRPNHHAESSPYVPQECQLMNATKLLPLSKLNHTINTTTNITIKIEMVMMVKLITEVQELQQVRMLMLKLSHHFQNAMETMEHQVLIAENQKQQKRRALPNSVPLVCLLVNAKLLLSKC